MATVKQRRLAKAIIENTASKTPLNKKELLVSSGYSEASATASAKDIIEQKGVQEALEDYGFNENEAMKVVAEIMKNPETNPNDRLKATDQVFKVRGTYAPEKKLVGTFALDDAKKARAKKAVRQLTSGGDS